MHGVDTDIVAHLNSVLKSKLTGINQYFLHARMLKHKGDFARADNEYKASIDMMKSSDMLVEHILTLGGLPDLQELGFLRIGHDAASMLKNDLLFSEASMDEIRAAMAYAEGKIAVATIAILRNIMESQQEHIDYLRKQLVILTPETEKDVA